ncbi:26S proteasome non-ATPase regulatory subunit 11 [Phakopsora pachyrhizi]|uniref:26S proteasome non-ATPase regulatory subunit 11 n=1 Tax=Phakopsora pachyrhizi TaxID=170000 RepID=A0AAV0AYH2_PHAPC|nr:26S proteasome non-ATPase regulatory subunit 11 [Phakopsora pachyrhizi]CAH7675233.1 26S proteasome non-ATPase regulatory subunit 11 [Phakopsora pachyrhizi]
MRVSDIEPLIKNSPHEAESELMRIISQPADPKDESMLKEKELALFRLGEFYRDNKNPEGLASAIRSCRSFMSAIAKAKTAKLVKILIDFYSSAPLNQHPNSSQIQIVITRENIEWARSEKRVFLRQSLEIKLCGLLFESQQTKEALSLIANLLKELKKLDDKMILTEVHLLESRIRHALSDPPKSKAALIAARTAANSIYCPPLLQSQLDMQSGVLHAEEKDYKTAYSYFFEALEGFASQDDPRASLALKCMLMCKVMLNLPEDVTAIQGTKLARKYSGRGTEAMQAIAKAHEDRNLAGFEEALKVYKAELSDDPIVRNHLASLYDTLLEQNLIRIIEPYSRIELSYISEQVKLPLRDVEAKLSQMILDKTFDGILDQGEGCLEVFDKASAEKIYDYSLETLKQIGSVVDSLYAKAQKLGQ